MSYIFKVSITQEIIDRPNVHPNERNSCLCYAALTDAGYDVLAVDTRAVLFAPTGGCAQPARLFSISGEEEYVPLPQKALDYLAPLLEAGDYDSDDDDGDFPYSPDYWRSLAKPFSYDLELPDNVQPVRKV